MKGHILVAQKWFFGMVLGFCFTAASAAETIKVGILHSLSGTMAISETSSPSKLITEVQRHIDLQDFKSICLRGNERDPL